MITQVTSLVTHQTNQQLPLTAAPTEPNGYGDGNDGEHFHMGSTNTAIIRRVTHGQNSTRTNATPRPSR